MPRTTSDNYGFGWVEDKVDSRDFQYRAPGGLLRSLPGSKDLRGGCPPVYAQEGLDSCTSNAIAAAVEFELMAETGKRVIFPSRLFIFYNTRAIEGTTRKDTGTSVRDGFKAVARHGVCPESLWPYVEKNYPKKPPKACYEKALKHRPLEYRRLRRDLDHLRACLAEGHPFVFGFTAYDLFRDVVWDTGVLEMPRRHEGLLGRHAVLAVGYDDSKESFIVRNSWGPGFGLKGYFMLPYGYVTERKHSSDFWTMRYVS